MREGWEAVFQLVLRLRVTNKDDCIFLCKITAKLVIHGKPIIHRQVSTVDLLTTCERCSGFYPQMGVRLNPCPRTTRSTVQMIFLSP